MAIKGKLPWALLFFCCCLCFSLPRSAADNALVDAVYQDALRLSPAEREALVSKLTNGRGASFPVRDLESVFDWRVPQRYRKLGHTYHGDTDRLRLAMHKLLTGQPMKIGYLGGSVTKGIMTEWDVAGHESFPIQLDKALAKIFPSANLGSLNGAIEATGSNYMSVCVNQHLPRDADLVFIEYAINDAAHPLPYMNNSNRMAYERLLRKVLQYPNRPAVMLVHYYNYVHFFEWWQNVAIGQFYANAESELQELAYYYHLPSVSVKAGFHHLMVQNVSGFKTSNCLKFDHPGTDTWRDNHAPPCDDPQSAEYFYSDAYHPNGMAGHRSMMELILNAMLEVALPMEADLSGAGNVTDDKARVEAWKIPDPMILGNFEAVTGECVFGKDLPTVVVPNPVGWNWTDEGRKKWGYVGNEPGVSLCMAVNTESTVHSQKGNGQSVKVSLVYLGSYDHMGMANVTCHNGCQCNTTTINAFNTDWRGAQSFFHSFAASQSPTCQVCLTILNETSAPNGEHKFKLTGLMVELDTGLESTKSNWNWAADHIKDWFGEDVVRWRTPDN